MYFEVGYKKGYKKASLTTLTTKPHGYYQRYAYSRLILTGGSLETNNN